MRKNIIKLAVVVFFCCLQLGVLADNLQKSTNNNIQRLQAERQHNQSLNKQNGENLKKQINYHNKEQHFREKYGKDVQYDGENPEPEPEPAPEPEPEPAPEPTPEPQPEDGGDNPNPPTSIWQRLWWSSQQKISIQFGMLIVFLSYILIF